MWPDGLFFVMGEGPIVMAGLTAVSGLVAVVVPRDWMASFLPGLITILLIAYAISYPIVEDSPVAGETVALLILNVVASLLPWIAAALGLLVKWTVQAKARRR